jgi:hypothetical protein
LREHRDSPKWPKPDPAYIQAVVSQGPTLAQLEANSPVRWTDGMPHAEEVVSTLFEKDELICVGKTKTYFETGPVSTWVRLIVLRQMQFIVPSPMRAWRGSTKKGELSARSLENTGPRCFLVCEFDQGTLDEHAALLAHLANYAPLVMAVHSGNKSVHGWFNCRGSSPDKVASFFGYAVRLGADPATWTSCQFVRMPDGLRDSGQRQRIIYFNPSILKAV